MEKGFVKRREGTHLVGRREVEGRERRVDRRTRTEKYEERVEAEAAITVSFGSDCHWFAVGLARSLKSNSKL